MPFLNHFLEHHNIYDYMAYFMRLMLKHKSDFNEIDHYMWDCYVNKKVNWAPVECSIYLGNFYTDFSPRQVERGNKAQ